MGTIFELPEKLQVILTLMERTLQLGADYDSATPEGTMTRDTYRTLEAHLFSQLGEYLKQEGA